MEIRLENAALCLVWGSKNRILLREGLVHQIGFLMKGEGLSSLCFLFFLEIHQSAFYFMSADSKVILDQKQQQNALLYISKLY